MKQAITVFKYEFLRYFNTPVAFVYLLAFLLLNGSCAFYLGNLLQRGIADLQPMFTFIPWLFLFFIPAISMRLWAEEFKTNTINQTLSMPVSITSYNIGKFLAAWGFSTIGLLLTTTFWLSLNFLASPDNGVILFAYISTFLLTGAMIAISLFASSITKNQIIALIVGISLSLFFFLSSLDFVLGFYKIFLPTNIVELVSNFSLLTHYSLMITGLIEAKAILFFISIIVFFNFLSILAVKSKSLHKNNYKLLSFIAFAGFIGFNLIAFQLLNFIDITKDNKYSLSQSTIKILNDLPEHVDAKLYYSEILSDKSAEFRELFKSTKTLLKQYQKASNQKFKLTIINPKTLSEEEDIAIADGLKGIPLLDSNQNGFFGLVLTDALDNKQVINLITPNQASFLESIITQKIYLLNNTLQNIGIITDLKMFEEVIGNVASQNWQIIEELKNFYNIKKIDNENPTIQDIKVLIIAAPKNMSQELVNNIKEYKQNGGKFIIMVDPAPEAIKLFAPQTEAIQATNLNGLEKEFGFLFLPQIFVADLDNSLTVDASIDTTQNPIITQDVAQIMLKEENINQLATSTMGLKNILLSSSTLIAKDSDNVEFIPLLNASKNSSLMNIGYIYQNINPAQILANFQKDNYQKFLAAKITEKNSKNPWQAIVIGDSDFVYDNYIQSTNNAYFLLNALDDLLNNHSLLSLRSKSNNIYRINKIEAMRKTAQKEYKIKENALLDKISEAKIKMQELLGKKYFEERQNFIADELALIAKLRQQINVAKNDLGTLKQNTYQNIESIYNKTIFINIYLLPLIIFALLLLKHKKSFNKNQKSQMYFDKKTAFFSIICLLLVVFGLFLNKAPQTQTSNQKAFKNINIQQVDKILIQHNKKTLELYKSDNSWQIKGHEGFEVYDARIKNLLTAISFATYYEKKSKKIENFDHFGLGKDNETQITLFENNNTTTNFYIGKYDIDLGRGSRGAYYRDDEDFDVWLLKADFIDITPNWREFSFSMLYNLRFGRVANLTAEQIKDMINTPLLSAHIDIKNKKEIFELNLTTDKEPITIKFYQADNKYFIQYNFNKMYYQISKENFESIKKFPKAK